MTPHKMTLAVAAPIVSADRVAVMPSASAESSACAHNWVDARNDHIQSGELCSNCLTVRAGNQTSEPSAPVEVDKREQIKAAYRALPHCPDPDWPDNYQSLRDFTRGWEAHAALADKGGN